MVLARLDYALRSSFTCQRPTIPPRSRACTRRRLPRRPSRPPARPRTQWVNLEPCSSCVFPGRCVPVRSRPTPGGPRPRAPSLARSLCCAATTCPRPAALRSASPPAIWARGRG